MTYAEMKEAIARAHSRACADLRAQLYAVNVGGGLTDDDAAELDAAIEAPRKGPRRPGCRACRKLGLGMQKDLLAPRFHVLFATGSPKQQASSWFCSRMVRMNRSGFFGG